MSDAAAAAYAMAPRERSRARSLVGDGGAAWLLTLPAIIAYLLMILLPLAGVLALAFTDYEFGGTSFRWIGSENFADMLKDRTFMASIRNTVIYCFFVVPLSIGIALLLAILIEAGARGRAFFRAVFFLPVVSLTVAMATAWQYLLHPSIGPVNAVLRGLGLGTPNWLGSSDWVLMSLGMIGVWENVGFNLVLFLAGLTAIPRELYGAAEVDGAKSAWSRFALVTWPLLGPTLLFVIIITMTRSIRVFDSVQTLTQGGPNNASEVLLRTIYQEGFHYFKFGYSAAITLVFLAIVLAVMLVQTRLIDRRIHYG
ncbi:MAG: sugar ABC transporter permease [Methylocystis sp.]|nr:sugar ABC transporter permease [Methylocystis sp.]MCA3582201.1 sugar ABC transporter permease [Methylocystis sp.]MCA3587907.1 sugar ABC transporter permease [Methylocystis sp.]MCA3590262.1 sugar ABC transporter permease [Methylocystis sp.]